MPTERSTSSKTKDRKSPDEREKLNERVAGKIKKASELRGPQRFLFYGHSGVGKTRLCATAPDVLIIDVNEKGTDSTVDTNPNVYPIEYWSEINDIYWYLQSGEHPYQTWAIDGVTGLQTLCMNFVLGDESARDASRDPDMPSRTVWGKVGQLMKTQITNFRNLPMNGIFTALARTRDSGEGSEDDMMLITGPNCSPSIAGHLEAAVGTIGYLHKKEVVVTNKAKGTKKKVTRRRLLTGSSERYITKDRNHAFGEYLDAPDVLEMLELIQKTKSREA